MKWVLLVLFLTHHTPFLCTCFWCGTLRVWPVGFSILWSSKLTTYILISCSKGPCSKSARSLCPDHMFREQCTGGGWKREAQSHGECTEAKREAYCWTISTSVHACELSPFSPVWLFATLWTVACRTPLSVGFSRQEYWSGLPCSSPRDLLNPGIKPESPGAPAFQMSFFFNHWATREPQLNH